MKNEYFILKQTVLKKIKDNKKLLKKRWIKKTSLYQRFTFIDNFINEEIFNQLLQYNLFEKTHYKIYKNFYESKKTTSVINKEFKLIYYLDKIFKDKDFLKCLQDLLDMPPLYSDHSNYAGGLSVMNKNDFLNPHLDNSHSKNKKLYRRLNLLFYLNDKNWNLSNGGNLEIWDRSIKNNKTILAKGNRLVIMETNINSWHSVSKVQSDKSRVCLSSYYYSYKSHSGGIYYHITEFAGRPDQLLFKVIYPITNGLRYLLGKIR